VRKSYFERSNRELAVHLIESSMDMGFDLAR
jgi:hypothetical protein